MKKNKSKNTVTNCNGKSSCKDSKTKNQSSTNTSSTDIGFDDEESNS